MAISRRGVLVGAAVSGGLLVAWGLRPRSYPAPLTPVKGEYAFAAWLKIAFDGVVTVAVPQLEMGQGITTILPQIVATELGADWRQMGVEAAPASGAYANIPLAAEWAPLWMPILPGLADDTDGILPERFAQESRFSATADGTSLAAFEMPCRRAAAIARQLLIEVAAERWNVSVGECDTERGFVNSGDRRLSFGSLAPAASLLDAPDLVPLRAEPVAEQAVPGQLAGFGQSRTSITSLDFPRLDLPAKVDGSFQFAADIRLPDMLYAAIKHGPVENSRLSAFDIGVVEGNRRITNVVKGKRWLAAVGTDWWSAEQAVRAMAPRFDVANVADSSVAAQRIEDALESGDGETIVSRGSGDETEFGFARRYSVAAATHATLETASVTARLIDGQLELWMASQSPEHARAAAATAIGFSVDNVVLYPMAAGGSFDRRLEHEHAIEAALIAREISLDRPRPVQLVWSRWQEHLAGLPRAPAMALMRARLEEKGGRMDALHSRIAVPPSGHEFGERLFGGKTAWAARKAAAKKADPMAVAGAMPVYAIPQVAIEHMPVDIGYPVGRMRGNAHGYTAFFTESFIDEAAMEANREPLSYRIEMLGNDPRMVECLQSVARVAQWDGGGDRSGQGLACHRMGAGRIACIANARLEGGGVRVSRLSVAVDIGRIVNIDIARQQIEGGLIFGLSQALGSTADYERGLPVAQRLADLDLPRLSDCPDIAIEFIRSDEEPFDPGELGVAVAAPAIANALSSATGRRFRKLPLLS